LLSLSLSLSRMVRMLPFLDLNPRIQGRSNKKGPGLLSGCFLVADLLFLMET
jgi:hypothetical protein